MAATCLRSTSSQVLLLLTDCTSLLFNSGSQRSLRKWFTFPSGSTTFLALSNHTCQESFRKLSYLREVHWVITGWQSNFKSTDFIMDNDVPRRKGEILWPCHIIKVKLVYQQNLIIIFKKNKKQRIATVPQTQRRECSRSYNRTPTEE